MDFLIMLKSPPKYGFTLWPLTLNVPFSMCMTSTPPYGKICITLNYPNHLYLSFQGITGVSNWKKKTLVVQAQILSE